MTRTVPNLRLHRRRGYGTLVFMMVLVVFIALLMLVVNYAYLAYSQLRVGDVSDTLARSAVSELLDENLLQPNAPLSQANDVQAARVVVGEFVDQLNDVSPPSQQLNFNPLSPGDVNNDVVVTPGYVDDLRLPVAGSNFQTGTGLHFNTLRVDAGRSSTGNNPLYLLVRGMAFPAAADIGSASFATLDSRLIGFEPTSSVNAPVVPIALQSTAWNGRSANINNNGRTDFTGRLKPANGTGDGTLLLLDFDQSASSVSPGQVAVQVQDGSSPDDIQMTSGDPNFLGPVLPANPSVPALELTADDTTPDPGSAGVLVNALNAVAASPVDARRVFSLYDVAPGAGDTTVDIVGFVAARVLGASIEGSGDNATLRLDLEPEFLVHFTAVTARTLPNGINAPVDVPENIYIHKLRLSR